MPQKRKGYSVSDKLRIIDRVKNGATKVSISRECGIPERNITGSMKEEHKLRNFVDTIQSEMGLQRIKTKLGADSELD